MSIEVYHRRSKATEENSQATNTENQNDNNDVRNVAMAATGLSTISYPQKYQ